MKFRTKDAEPARNADQLDFGRFYAPLKSNRNGTEKKMEGIIQ